MSSLQPLTIRLARREDAAELTSLYHDAFAVWKEQGLRFGPMYQTLENTIAHVESERVFVAEEPGGRLLGTIAVDARGRDLLEYLDVPHSVPPGRLLTMRKAAVLRSLAGSGIGRRLFDYAEAVAHTEGFIGIIGEVVREARWTFDWYRRWGFQEIGTYRYPDSKLDTVLMVKLF